jgi:hypothetical protein
MKISHFFHISLRIIFEVEEQQFAGNMEDIDIWNLISETSILLSTSLSYFRTNLYKLRFTPQPHHPSHNCTILCTKRFRSPYKKYRTYDRTWISNKRKGFSSKRTLIFIYNKGSNIEVHFSLSSQYTYDIMA